MESNDAHNLEIKTRVAYRRYRDRISFELLSIYKCIRCCVRYPGAYAIHLVAQCLDHTILSERKLFQPPATINSPFCRTLNNYRI